MIELSEECVKLLRFTLTFIYITIIPHTLRFLNVYEIIFLECTFIIVISFLPLIKHPSSTLLNSLISSDKKKARTNEAEKKTIKVFFFRKKS